MRRARLTVLVVLPHQSTLLHSALDIAVFRGGGGQTRTRVCCVSCVCNLSSIKDEGRIRVLAGVRSWGFLPMDDGRSLQALPAFSGSSNAPASLHSVLSSRPSADPQWPGL
jgi:hypothetical protein